MPQGRIKPLCYKIGQYIMENMTEISIFLLQFI